MLIEWCELSLRSESVLWKAFNAPKKRRSHQTGILLKDKARENVLQPRFSDVLSRLS